MGTYREQDVSWLVRDITNVANDVGLHTIQLGPDNQTVMPVESAPTPAQLEFFRTTTLSTARELAVIVGVLAEAARHRRGPEVAFASIIRAGVPVGILLRRWLVGRYGTNTRHYAMSIVPAHGLDRTAMRYLAQHHRPEQVVFVDGWTGRGNITLEVIDTINQMREEGLNFIPELAVLADPCECSTLYGTRRDVFLSLACLDSSATGLTTKTFYWPQWTADGHFNAIVRNPQFEATDHSRWFVDQVSAHFEDVQDEVDTKVAKIVAGPGPVATMAGRAATNRFATKYQVDNPYRVKAGIGESSRALVFGPGGGRLIARPDHGPELEPVLELATIQGIAVEWDHELEFQCVAITPPLAPVKR